jgi:hypothetical protein
MKPGTVIMVTGMGLMTLLDTDQVRTYNDFYILITNRKFLLVKKYIRPLFNTLLLQIVVRFRLVTWMLTNIRVHNWML